MKNKKNTNTNSNRKRKVIVVLLMILIPVIVLGVVAFNDSGALSSGMNGKKDTVTQLRFKDLISISELKKLENKQVSIVGFMAPVSPLDGSFAYILNMPFQTCPFCVPNTTELANTIAIYPKEGSTIAYTDAPVLVTGKLVFGDFVDEYNYVYGYRLEDVKVEFADESLLDDNVNVYGAIAKEGIFDDLNLVFANLDSAIYYKEYEAKEEDIQKIEIDAIKSIERKLEAYDSEEYNEMITVAISLEQLGEKINKVIDEKNYTELPDFSTEFDAIYMEFYNWVTQFEV